MNGTIAVLLVALLTVFGSLTVLGGVFSPSDDLPPLEEDKVQAHWIQEGEPAPFSGILLNDYTYKRLRLKLEFEK